MNHKHRICIVLQGPTPEEAFHEIKLCLEEADLFELRLDLFSFWSLSDIENLMRFFNKPFLLTLRGKDQGGGFIGSEEERKEILLQLAELKPSFMDLEYSLPASFFEKIKTISNATSIIASFHDFQEVPFFLKKIAVQLLKLPCSEIKIVCHAKNSLDSFRMLEFLMNYKGPKPVTAFCMGFNGEFSRILAPKFGSLISYTFNSSSKPSASGQIDCHTLRNLYRVDLINHETDVYALIGDPVIHSKGIYFHNTLFKKLRLNSVYVRIKIEVEELKSALFFMRTLGFKGLSVTMPLKEMLIPFLDESDDFVKLCKSTNTILLKEKKIKGANTDGIGAMILLEKKTSLKNKKISILGAGGAARAIAFVCALKGAKITIYNRTLERAKSLARDVNDVIENSCTAKSLENYFPGEEEIIIQTTSKGMNENEESILTFSKIPEKKIAFDVVSYPQKTQFIKWCLQKGAITITGRELFIEQAIEQYAHWFEENIDKEAVRTMVNEEI